VARAVAAYAADAAAAAAAYAYAYAAYAAADAAAYAADAYAYAAADAAYAAAAAADAAADYARANRGLVLTLVAEEVIALLLAEDRGTPGCHRPTGEAVVELAIHTDRQEALL
jgi:hypothetical protein